ncbi:MAG: hypothetical protein WC408_00040 [Candidatus Micrarchaeia archaeon]
MAQKKQHSRAFIAAPLLGTLIFLIAIIYAVNLSKDEASAISQIGDDAYHNRLVSMLDLYRSDLLAFFADGLRQNSEDFMANYAWADLNDISEFTSAERSAKCTSISDTFHEELTSSAYSSEGTFLNGLSDLLREVRSENTFETLTFSPVKFDTFSSSFGGGDVVYNFHCGDEPGRTLCKRLLPMPYFDCANYGSELKNPYQCKIGGNLISGCEEGNFYLGVNVDDADVFKALPRIQVTDTYGNSVRTSVLGTTSFPVPIRYPIFRYNDAAFRVFSIVQYGNSNAAKASTAPSSRVSVPEFDPKTLVYSFRDACAYLASDKNFSDLDFEVKFTVSDIVLHCTKGNIINNGVTAAIKAIEDFEDLREGQPPVSRIFDFSIIDNDARFRVNKNTPNTYVIAFKLKDGSESS